MDNFFLREQIVLCSLVTHFSKRLQQIKNLHVTQLLNPFYNDRAEPEFHIKGKLKLLIQ